MVIVMIIRAWQAKVNLFEQNLKRQLTVLWSGPRSVSKCWYISFKDLQNLDFDFWHYQGKNGWKHKSLKNLISKLSFICQILLLLRFNKICAFCHLWRWPLCHTCVRFNKIFVWQPDQTFFSEIKILSILILKLFL